MHIGKEIFVILYSYLLFRCICKIAKSVYWLHHVCPHRTTQLPLDRFSWNYIFKYFLKLYQENSSFI